MHQAENWVLFLNRFLILCTSSSIICQRIDTHPLQLWALNNPSVQYNSEACLQFWTSDKSVCLESEHWTLDSVLHQDHARPGRLCFPTQEACLPEWSGTLYFIILFSQHSNTSHTIHEVEWELGGGSFKRNLSWNLMVNLPAANAPLECH